VTKRSAQVPSETLACKPVSVACEPCLQPLLPRVPGNGFRTPETEGPKPPLSCPCSLQRPEAGLCAAQNRGYSANNRKPRLAQECVVEVPVLCERVSVRPVNLREQGFFVELGRWTGDSAL